MIMIKFFRQWNIYNFIKQVMPDKSTNKKNYIIFVCITEFCEQSTI